MKHFEHEGKLHSKTKTIFLSRCGVEKKGILHLHKFTIIISITRGWEDACRSDGRLYTQEEMSRSVHLRGRGRTVEVTGQSLRSGGQSE